MMPRERPTTARLLLTVREAAEALSISDRKLWDLTEPRGPIRCVRVGRAVRYHPPDLERWIDEEKGEKP